MVSLTAALGLTVPYFNLTLVLVVLYLFYRLFREPTRKGYLLPWKVIFIAVLVYIVEEALTALRAIGLVTIQAHINGFFEIAIIILFIYAVLMQKQYITKGASPAGRGRKR